MPQPPCPPQMGLDGPALVAAAGQHWTYRCPIKPCTVQTQGGLAGLAAHRAACHPEHVHPSQRRMPT